MLEFIVLGQIPGTHLVITFSWVIAITMTALGTSIVKHEYRQHLMGQKPQIEEVAL